MRVVRSISTVKAKLLDILKTCMFLCYTKNHTGGTCRMLNIRTKRIVLIRNIIWIKKTYRVCVSRKVNIKAYSYILKN